MIGIDSCKLRIPIELVGETRLTNQKLRFTNDGITGFEIGLEKQRTVHTINQYITIKFSSKLLKESYYERINPTNLYKIVDYINSIEQLKNLGVSVTEDMLLEAEVTDIDFCKNIIMSQDRFYRLVEWVKINTKDTDQRDRGYTIYNRKDNQGVSYSNRRTATPTNPYIKIYNKYLDTISDKHWQFFAKYKIQTDPNTFRIEFTLKNKKHFDKYGIESNKLKDMFLLEQKFLNSIIRDMVHINIEKPLKARPIRKYTDVEEIYLRYLVELAKKHNIHHSVIKKQLLQHVKDRRIKKRVEEKIKYILAFPE